MPVQDSNPERRNLTVLSLCIILYYIAGGKFSDGSVRLQVVNVDFSKPEVLAYSAWFLLVWFCFRYWLVHQGKWKIALVEELSTGGNASFVYYKYLMNKFELSHIKGRHIMSFHRKRPDDLVFSCVINDKKGACIGRQELIIGGFYDKCILYLCVIFMLFRRPALSGYFVPYLLFIVAGFLGFYYSLLPTLASCCCSCS